jgi:FKBP-type peptidyl-prolyl cis-trans isomerase
MNIRSKGSRGLDALTSPRCRIRLTSAPFSLSHPARKERAMQAGLGMEDIRAGVGVEAKAGTTVTVHYVGTLTDGRKFDSSRDRGQGFTFRLGAGQVIKGWDQGVAGMRIGGIRKLTIPPELGYGARGFPPVIPPNATLLFEVELLAVQ